jgi:ankyrin repeat protein
MAYHIEQADLNAKLQLAATNGPLGHCEVWLERGADVSAADDRGFTALSNAAIQGNVDICALLLSHGADLRQECFKKLTAMQMAVRWGQPNVVDYLVREHGEDIDQVTCDGETLDALALQNGTPEMINYLLVRRSEITGRAVEAAMNAGQPATDCSVSSRNLPAPAPNPVSAGPRRSSSPSPL